jgi:hypothetical protein
VTGLALALVIQAGLYTAVTACHRARSAYRREHVPWWAELLIGAAISAGFAGGWALTAVVL